MVSDFSAPLSKSVRNVGCLRQDLNVSNEKAGWGMLSRVRCPTPPSRQKPLGACRPHPSLAPSLYRPQGALGRATQRAPLVGLITLNQRFHLAHEKKEKPHCVRLFFLVAEAGFEPTTAQVAVPDVLFAHTVRSKTSTAAPCSPSFFVHRTRSARKQVIRPRAHNPSVPQVSSCPQTNKNTNHSVGVFCLVAEAGFEPTTSGL